MSRPYELQHLALDSENNIIDIKNIEDNKEYYCPYCHNLMIPKRGKTREWHFAHKPNQTVPCSYDNYLHSLAEIMIMDWFNRQPHIYLYMETTEKCRQYKDCKFYDDKCSKPALIPFDLKKYYTKCTQEIRFQGFVADLFCDSVKYEEQPIFIEIYVTHECEEIKKNSGIRIVEIKISSEEDIMNVIQSDKLIESENIKLHNFYRKEILTNEIVRRFNKFVLFPSTRSYIDREQYTCKNYATHRKGVFEISMPSEYCIPCFMQSGGMSMIGKSKAYIEGFLEKDCQLCYWKGQDWEGTNFCKLYKKCGNPKYCTDNDSLECTMFKVDRPSVDIAIAEVDKNKDKLYILNSAILN